MKVVLLAAVCGALVGCSTAGGIYKGGDAVNGEFSPGRTFLSILGVAAAAAAGRHGGGGVGGSSPAAEEYAWDWQPAIRQWVCRSKDSGRYAHDYECAGAPKLDYWP